MKKIFKKKKIFLLFLGLIIIAVLGYFNVSKYNLPAQAELYDIGPPLEGDNLSGFAWSSNIGWISFNSSDCDTDGDGTFEGAGEFGGAAPAGCPTSGVAEDYGVHVAMDTGDLKGYAWSENVGWVSFEEIGLAPSDSNDATNPDYDFAANCYMTSACDTTNCTACYNFSDKTIYGWAKILSLDDDGWISLNGSSPAYSVEAVVNDELSGWAWNGNNVVGTGIGWISFNCLNEGVCGTSDYKVNAYLNQKPVANNLTAPQWNGNAACINDDARRATLSWEFIDPDVDAFATAYQLILTDTGNTNLAGDDSVVLDTGKCTGDGVPVPACTIDLSGPKYDGDIFSYYLDSGILVYDTSYRWEVLVWDDYGQVSEWAYFNVVVGAGADSTLIGDEGVNAAESPEPDVTFTTYAHEFPQPYFTWSPAQIAVDEESLFVSRGLSKYFTDASPGVGFDCTDSNCDYEWDKDTTLCDIVDDLASSTIITFEENNNNSMKLFVTDNDGYVCSTSTVFTIEQRLPMWIEAR